ncbi:ATP-binding cassette domain-containing protein [Vibrio aestuarianus]|uniref:ATP-binding cassette domain-containing protein n=1 Tax=Vibrio aestuarianus TaxID=28171 RepID=UPI004068305D
MLELRQLVKTYDNGHQAVKGVDLSIKKGEFIVLVGPSGCGKSSILRSIAGLEAISGGEIHLAGRQVDNEKPALRDIAMVFQNYALYPHMSVYDNLAYGLKNRNVDKATIESKITKVAMGRAIVRDPQLFLFDEPLSNLDAALRAHMRLEIKKLQRELGVTSVYVTHDQVEAMTLADRIVVLNQGKIEQVGTPAQVYHQPASQFVASFMGSPAMNFIPAKLASGYLHIGSQHIYLPDYRSLPSQNITVGIRPEHANTMPSNDAIELNMNIAAVEPLGPNQLVHGIVGKQPFIAVTDEIHLDHDKPLHLFINLTNLHIFDEHGKRLCPIMHTKQAIA